MADKFILNAENLVPRLSEYAFQEPLNWTVRPQQNWAIIGPNGGGKSMFIDLVIGKYALRSGAIQTVDNLPKSQIIKTVAFKDIYSLADLQNSYYQQRWNAGDEHEVPSVSELLLPKDGDVAWLNMLVQLFGIQDLLSKEINLLSSGELRKTLVIRALLSKPRILILDNPFIGLDADSRIVLNEVLAKISEIQDIQIVLVLSNPADIPSVITDVLVVKDKTVIAALPKDKFLADANLQNEIFKLKNIPDIGSLMQDADIPPFRDALRFNSINIRYGARQILKDVSWTVQNNEKWALLGKNGSGKSTLLSLVCGDNPQAYANDIMLFDRKRGSGESIWDIKKRIGYISPEMHLYYMKNVKCIDVVGSGFFDTIGLYRKCSAAQEKIAVKWMAVFGVDALSDRPFLQTSSGEQRLVLLARVFVKNPDLLILDEPLHGLDLPNKQLVKRVIERFCRNNKALIYVTHYEDEIPDVVTRRLTLVKP